MMDLDAPLGRLLDAPETESEPMPHRLDVEIGGRRFAVGFRLPNGADQEAAGAVAAEDLGRAADLLLRRTLVSVTAADGETAELDALLPALRAPMAEAFSRLDPEAEIVLRLQCPDCGRETPAELDPYVLLMSRMLSGRDIFVDVDRIARAYHWSEAEIMALPITRRRRYLAMIGTAGAPA